MEPAELRQSEMGQHVRQIPRVDPGGLGKDHFEVDPLAEIGRDGEAQVAQLSWKELSQVPVPARHHGKVGQALLAQPAVEILKDVRQVILSVHHILQIARPLVAKDAGTVDCTWELSAWMIPVRLVQKVLSSGCTSGLTYRWNLEVTFQLCVSTLRTGNSITS